MKTLKKLLLPAILISALSTFAVAQDEKGKDGEKGKGRPPGAAKGPDRGGRPPGGALMMLPVHAALDADKNGEISADEIGQASEVLGKLDKNKDGKLTEDELRPDFSRMRQGGGDRPTGDRPQTGGGSMAERLKEMDKNSNGKIEAEEIPEERRERMLEFLDKNGDNAIDKAELEAMAQRFRDGQGGKGKGGEAGKGRGGAPAGGGEGVKPKRPPLEE